MLAEIHISAIFYGKIKDFMVYGQEKNLKFYIFLIKLFSIFSEK